MLRTTYEIITTYARVILQWHEDFDVHLIRISPNSWIIM